MRILIWGAGEEARVFYNYLKEDIELVAIVDNSKSLCGKKIEELGSAQVISPEMIEDYQYDYLCICTMYLKLILLQCKKMGLMNCISGRLYIEDYKVNSFLLKPEAQLLVAKNEMDNSTLRYAKENNWCNVYHDTIRGIDWYDVKSISLGRWAIGYNYAYVLVRALNAISPKNILECGLGQSTKILNSYAKNREGVMVDVVEQDESWIKFFSIENELSSNVYIHHNEIEERTYDEGECYVYSDFGDVVQNKKYSLISIDGPWGGDLVSRMDILDYVPAILEDDFVILIDDYERIGEKNMIDKLVNKLEANDIKTAKGLYRGEKDVAIVVPLTYKFMTTM